MRSGERISGVNKITYMHALRRSRCPTARHAPTHFRRPRPERSLERRPGRSRWQWLAPWRWRSPASWPSATFQCLRGDGEQRVLRWACASTLPAPRRKPQPGRLARRQTKPPSRARSAMRGIAPSIGHVAVITCHGASPWRACSPVSEQNSTASTKTVVVRAMSATSFQQDPKLKPLDGDGQRIYE